MEKYYAAYFCLGRVIKDSLVEYLISEARSSLVEFSSSRYLQVTSSYFFCGVLKAFPICSFLSMQEYVNCTAM
jgi:hypothetical protein